MEKELHIGESHPIPERNNAKKRGLPKDDREYDYDEEGDHYQRRENKLMKLEMESSLLAGRVITEPTDICATAESSHDDGDGSYGPPGLDNFCGGDIVTVVYDFLAARELYSLAFCSKSLVAKIRYEHVIRAAVLQGGYANNTVGEIVRLLRGADTSSGDSSGSRSIFVPSPIRLLRLANGKRCEGRAGKDMLRHCCNRVKVMCKGYGVFLCSSCLADGGATHKVARNSKWTPFLSDARVAQRPHPSCTFVFRMPYVDSTGVRCGPLISHWEMQQLMNSYGSLQEHFAKMNAIDKHAKDVNRISSLFEESTKCLLVRRDERKKARAACQYARHAKRCARVKALINILSEHFNDSLWKDMALSYEWTTDRNQPCVRFDCVFVQQAMKAYVLAPSKATKKKMDEVAQQITEFFCLFSDLFFSQAHVVDFTLLSDDVNNDLMEHMLQTYCERTVNSRVSLQRQEANLRLSDLVGEGQLLEALETCMGHNLFTQAVVENITPASLTGADRDDAHLLAWAIWRSKLSDERENLRHARGSSGMTILQNLVRRCREHFTMIYSSMNSDPKTREYLVLRDFDGLIRYHREKFPQAINSFRAYKLANPSTL